MRTLLATVIQLLPAVAARADGGSCSAFVDEMRRGSFIFPAQLLASVSPACTRDVEARGTLDDLLAELPDPRLDAELVLACTFHQPWAVETMARGLDAGRPPQEISFCLNGLAAAGPEAAAIVDSYLGEHAIEGGKLNDVVVYPLVQDYATPEYAAHLWPVFRRALGEVDAGSLDTFVKTSLCRGPLDPEHATLCKTARARIADQLASFEQHESKARRHRFIARIWRRVPMLIGAVAYVTASHFVGDHVGHEVNVAGGAVALGAAGYAMTYEPDSSVGPGLPRLALTAKELLLTALGACAGAGLASLAPDGSHVTTSAVEATVFSVATLAGTW